jgi:hypothetical protein
VQEVLGDHLLPSHQSKTYIVPSNNNNKVNLHHWISEGEVEIAPCHQSVGGKKHKLCWKKHNPAVKSQLTPIKTPNSNKGKKKRGELIVFLYCLFPPFLVLTARDTKPIHLLHLS